jgi:hypothetical protein
MTTTSELGPVGISLDIDPAGGHLAAAAEIERLGYSTLWIPGGQLDRLDRITVAPGIIPVDVYPADAVARWHAELSAEAPGRVLVGLGGPQQQPRPLRALGHYLDLLDAPTRRYRRRAGSWPRSARASWRWPGTAPAVRCRCW